jgi:hypothetical protein
MFEFFIVMFGGRVFQQTVGIHMGTNRAPLLVDLFHYSHKVDFTQEYLKKNDNGCNRMVVGVTTTCAISAYHH